MATKPSAVALRSVTALARDIDHARFAGLVEMTETPRGHCAASRCFAGTPVRSARVAAVDVGLAHQALADEERTDAGARRAVVTSSWVKMPLSAMTMRSLGTRGCQASVTARSVDESLEVAVVDADQPGVEGERAVKLRFVVHLDEHVHAEIVRRRPQARAPSHRRRRP